MKSASRAETQWSTGTGTGVLAVLLIALALVVGACGGAGSGGAESAEAKESGGESTAGVSDDVKEDISVCVLEGAEDPAVKTALEGQDVTALTDAQVQALIGTLGACSAEGLGMSGAAATCLQKAFAAAASRYPDVRALAAEIVTSGDTSRLEASVMQAAMSPSVCTTEEREAMLAGAAAPESG